MANVFFLVSHHRGRKAEGAGVGSWWPGKHSVGGGAWFQLSVLHIHRETAHPPTLVDLSRNLILTALRLAFDCLRFVGRIGARTTKSRSRSFLLLTAAMRSGCRLRSVS